MITPGIQSPTSADRVIVKNGRTLTVNVANAVCGELILGVSGGSGNGNGTLRFDGNRDLRIIATTAPLNGNVILGDSPRTGSIDMSSGGNLKISGSLVTTNVGTFTPRTGNVEFTGSTQAIPSFNALGNKAYNNLILSGSGTKSFDAATSVTGDLSIANGVKAGLSSANYSAGSLTLGGAGTINGSWGSLSSTATNKTDAYFSGTGILNVTTNTNPCTAPFITVQPANDSKTYGDNASFSVTALGSGTLSYQWEEFDSSWLPVTDGGFIQVQLPQY